MTAALVETGGLLSQAEARSLTDEVKNDAERLWRKLVELYEGGAHTTLGYSSWGAYFKTEFGGTKSKAYQLLSSGQVVAELERGSVSDLKLPTNHEQARELRPLLKQPEKLREVWAAVAETHPKPTAADVREAVRRRSTVVALTSSESVEWYTPARYVDLARDFLGGIDLDPASNDFANETVRADSFYTEADDGLAQKWHGRVWINPPYGAKCPLFVQKLTDEYDSGRVTEALLLVNAYSTETRWFQPLLSGQPICFVRGRIDFYSPSSRNSTPTHGSAIVYFGERPARFAEAFSPLGVVVQAVAA